MKRRKDKVAGASNWTIRRLIIARAQLCLSLAEDVVMVQRFVMMLTAAVTFIATGSAMAQFDQCPNEKGGNCHEATPGIGGCCDEACCNLVCDVDPVCCIIEWDEVCVNIAQGLGCGGFCGEGVKLWDQSDYDEGVNAFVDQVFDDFPDFDSYLVTDIDTGGDAWVINSVMTFFTNGNDWANAGVKQGRLNIFPKTGNLPDGADDPGAGQVVDITIIDQGDTIAITAAGLSIELTPGEYWVGLTPLANFGVFGQEFHRGAPIIGDDTAWRNPGGGFGLGAEWSDTGVLAPDWVGAFDAAISITGKIGGGGGMIETPVDLTAINLHRDPVFGFGLGTNDPETGDMSGSFDFNVPVLAAGMVLIDKAIIWGFTIWHPTPLGGATPLSESANDHLSGSMTMHLDADGQVTGLFDLTSDLMDIDLDFANFTGDEIPSSVYILRVEETVVSTGPGMAHGTGVFIIDEVVHGTFDVDYVLDGNPNVEIDPIAMVSVATVSLSGKTMSFDGNAVVMPAPDERCLWDLDEDGNVGTGDLILLLGSWGDPYGTQDLIELLGAWGPCPR